MEDANTCNISKIKSKFIIKLMFSFLTEKKKLYFAIYNKKLQKKIDVNIIDYKRVGRDKIAEYKKGIVKEFLNGTNILIFEGEYLNGKRHGKGVEYYQNHEIKFKGEYKEGKMWSGTGYNIFRCKEFDIYKGKGIIFEYDYFGTLLFKGEYLNGMKNGKGRDYYNDAFSHIIKFEGEYFDGKIWNGKGYNYKNGNEEFKIEDGEGIVKEYDKNNKLIFDGEYKNGLRNGKGKEFYENNELKFDGEYKNGLRNGKGKEFYENEKLLFDGEYLNGLRHGFGKEYYKNGKLLFEGEYLNGKRNGDGKEMDNNGISIFKGEYSNGIRWNGTGSEYNDELLEFKGLYFKGKRWNGTLYEYDWETGEITYQGKILEGIKIEDY